MSKLKTIVLEPDRWGELTEIEREAFNDPMPTNVRQTMFLAAVDGANDDIAGYIRVEHLYHLVHVYTRPDRRNHASVARQLMEEAARIIPPGFSGIWLARKPYPQIAEELGAQEKGTFIVYRRDN